MPVTVWGCSGNSWPNACTGSNQCPLGSFLPYTAPKVSLGSLDLSPLGRLLSEFGFSGRMGTAMCQDEHRAMTEYGRRAHRLIGFICFQIAFAAGKLCLGIP